MKNFKFTSLAAAVLLWGLAGCSSTTSESTTTTAEGVTTDRTTAKTNIEATSANKVPPGSDSVAAFVDSTTFQYRAASYDIFEVQSGIQAKTKATNAEVKKFAEQMVTDHTKSNDELKQIAGMRNLTLPNTALGGHQRMLNTLTNEKDMDEFDKEYMDMQVSAHKQAVEIFESAAKNQSDPELKAYAARHLPHLKMHLGNAQQIKATLK